MTPPVVLETHNISPDRTALRIAHGDSIYWAVMPQHEADQFKAKLAEEAKK